MKLKYFKYLSFNLLNNKYILCSMSVLAKLKYVRKKHELKRKKKRFG